MRANKEYFWFGTAATLFPTSMTGSGFPFGRVTCAWSVARKDQLPLAYLLTHTHAHLAVNLPLPLLTEYKGRAQELG